MCKKRERKEIIKKAKKRKKNTGHALKKAQIIGSVYAYYPIYDCQQSDDHISRETTAPDTTSPTFQLVRGFNLCFLFFFFVKKTISRKLIYKKARRGKRGKHRRTTKERANDENRHHDNVYITASLLPSSEQHQVGDNISYAHTRSTIFVKATTFPKETHKAHNFSVLPRQVLTLHLQHPPIPAASKKTQKGSHEVVQFAVGPLG